MTKNEYLIELAVKIQSIAEKPSAIHDELKAMINFYQELIEDKMEDGMTEEEAVAAMEPIDEIIERLKGELAEMNTPDAQPALDDEEQYEMVYPQPHDSNERMRLEYAPGSLSKIMIEDSNSGIQIKPGDTVAVNYCNNDEGHYEVTEAAGVLVVKYIRHKRGLFRLFSFRKKRDELVLEVPLGWDGALAVRTSNARIEMEAEITDILLKTSNAKIEILTAVADRLRAVSGNGKISAGNIRCREAELATSNSKVEATDVNASERIKIETSNGTINAVNVSAPRIIAHTSNGGVKVQDIAGDDITLTTSNGNITGTVRGMMDDYAITSKTTNGKNNLSSSATGTKKLDVRTSNGNIAVDFAG